MGLLVSFYLIFVHVVYGFQATGDNEISYWQLYVVSHSLLSEEHWLNSIVFVESSW